MNSDIDKQLNCIPVGMADLSGIGGNPGDLFVSNVIHKVFVEVNEEGTKQAFYVLLFSVFGGIFCSLATSTS